jgi:MFS family permease
MSAEGAAVMTESTKPASGRSPFDDWRSIVVALYMTLIGYGVMVGIPVISTAWVELLGFTEEQVGRVAGADLGGLALGSVLTAFVAARWNRRTVAFVGLLIAVVANGLCTIYVTYEQVLWLRVLRNLHGRRRCNAGRQQQAGTGLQPDAVRLCLFPGGGNAGATNAVDERHLLGLHHRVPGQRTLPALDTGTP